MRGESLVVDVRSPAPPATVSAVALPAEGAAGVCTRLPNTKTNRMRPPLVGV